MARNFQFNREDFDALLERARKSDALMLQDTREACAI